MTLPDWLRRRWTKLTVNWFTIGWTCARRGHQWRTARVATLDLTDCAWCGRFGGWRRMTDEATAPRPAPSWTGMADPLLYAPAGEPASVGPVPPHLR